ncbi:hypothetical protein GCM10010442_17720 [Kitasatospora kifunensis]
MSDRARSAPLDELHPQAGRIVAQDDGTDAHLGHLQALVHLREPESAAVPGFLGGEVGDREADVVEPSSGGHGSPYG